MKLSTKPLLIAALIALLLILAGGNALAYFPPESASYCLGCHSGSQLWPQDDKTAFVNTGHFKVLRAVTPGTELLGPDGQHYTDPGFDWSAGTYTYNGTTYKMSYIFGGMLGFNNIFGNAVNPVVVDDTGMIVGYGMPYATSSCAMCHTTGYRWWDGNVYNEIQAFNLGGILDTSAPTSAPTSSLGTVRWNENGVSCIRCHYYQKRLGSNWYDENDMWPFYADTSTNALCGKCHQGPYNNGFMNSPHARFSGNWAQLADPSQYNSDFTRNYGGGCTECHDVHKSLIGEADASKTWWGGGIMTFPGRQEANATYCSNSSVSSSDPNLAADCATAGGTVVIQQGAVKNCVACHNGSSAVATINHSMGPGTPFAVYPSGGATDPTDACYVCHMPSGKHLFRINPDPNYSYTPQDATTCINSVPGGYGSWTPNCSLPAGTSWTSTTCATVGGTWNSTTSTCTLPAATCSSVGGTWDITTGTCTGTLTMPSPFVTSTTCASAGAALGVTATYAPGCKDTRDGSAAGKATSDGTWQYAQWNDLDMSCGQCHGGTGGPTATVNNAPYFTKAQLSAAAKGIHTGILDPDTCLTCHSTTQGPMAAVVPGTNHHSGLCTTCHDTGAADGRAPHDNTDPSTTNTACLACHSTSGTGASHHALTALTAACTSCHTNPGVALPDDCLACHPAETTLKYTMPGITCADCHTHPGVIPVTSGTGSVCMTCHTSDSYYAPLAANMHLTRPTANFGFTVSGLTATVFGESSSCMRGPCNYSWNTTGSGAIADPAGVSTAITYPESGTFSVTLTVTDSVSGLSASVSKDVTVTQPNRPPVAAFAEGSPSASGWTVSVTDNSTDPDERDLTGPNAITVAWGNGSTSRTVRGGTVSHTYTVAGGYLVSLAATDNSGLTSTVTAPVTISLATVTGTVKNVLGAGVSTVKVTITVAGVTKTAYTNSTGTYTISNVKPGTGLVMTATKGLVTYGTQTWVTSGVKGTVNSGSNTVNFTP